MSDIKLSENALPAEFQISKFYIPRKRLEKVPREKKYRNLKNSSKSADPQCSGGSGRVDFEPCISCNK